MTDNATLIDVDGCPTIRFERRLRVPVERAWQAVTDEDEMKAWFPSTVIGERRVGASLQFTDDPNITGTTGTVLEWEPPRVFAFDWNGDHLRIALTPDGDDTRLVFTHRVSDVSVAARNGAGWHACLASLDAHLEGREPPSEWEGMYGDYVDRMGPPLAQSTRQWSFTWERAHHVSVERVWECLTDPKELEAWMGYPVAIDLRLGGTVRFFEGDGAEVGVIVVLDAPNRIAYTWGSTLAVVDWAIEPIEHGCRYRLTKHGMPEDRAAGWGAGWHSFLLQLDMYAASGQLVVDAHEPRIPAYRSLLP